jgi:anti-anti-sigma factor
VVEGGSEKILSNRKEESKMTIEKISEDILLVELPFAGSKMAEVLNNLMEKISDQRTYHVIIDFFRVELISSSNIGTLLVLRSMLQNADYQLVICNVKAVTKGIFIVGGLRRVFTFAKNREAAFATLRYSKLPASMC